MKEILAKADHQRTFVGQHFIDHWDELITEYILSKKFSEELITNLAFDAMYKFEVKKEWKSDVAKKSIIDIFFGLSIQLNVSQFRALKFAREDFIPEILSGNPDAQTLVDKLTKSITLKDRKDFFDTEIAHYPAVGWAEAGEIHTVIAFTCDPSFGAKNRCGLYYFYIKNIYEIIRALPDSDINDSFDLREPRPGTLCICMESGELFEVAAVDTLPAQIFEHEKYIRRPLFP